MHDYIVRNDGPQPAAYTNRMPPAPQPVDPRMLAMAMQQLGAMQEQPMSTGDGINITISIEPQGEVYAENYIDPYAQAGEAYSQSQAGHASMRPSVDMPDKYTPLRNRASEIITKQMGSCGDMGHYDVGTRKIRRR